MLTPTKPPGSAKALIAGIGHREELEVPRAVGLRRDEPMAELVQVVVDLGVVEIGARRRGSGARPISPSLRSCAGEASACDSSPRSGSDGARWRMKGFGSGPRAAGACGVWRGSVERLAIRRPDPASIAHGADRNRRPARAAGDDERDRDERGDQHGADAARRRDERCGHARATSRGPTLRQNADAKMRDACRSSSWGGRCGAHARCRRRNPRRQCAALPRGRARRRAARQRPFYPFRCGRSGAHGRRRRQGRHPARRARRRPHRDAAARRWR